MQRSLKGKVTGVDYSPVSVEKSRKVNANAIANGRCTVLEASVSSLPFNDNTFNMATAFETVYFWPDIEKSFSEVKRILAPGGKFLIVNEDDGLSGNNDPPHSRRLQGHHHKAQRAEALACRHCHKILPQLYFLLNTKGIL